MKKKSFVNRLGTMALAGMMALSPMASLVSPLEVLAAPSASHAPLANFAAERDTNDGLTIRMVDADVYGTDVNAQRDPYTIISHDLYGYWASQNYSVWDIAHTPQGNSTFEHTQIGIWALDPTSENRLSDSPVKKYTCSNDEFHIPDSDLSELYNTLSVKTTKFEIATYTNGAGGIRGNSSSDYYNADWNLKFMFNGSATSIKIADGYGSNTDLDDVIDLSANHHNVIDFHSENGVLTSNYGAFVTAYQQHPFYGDVKFTVNDKDFGDGRKGQSQGDADLSGAKFAVFNISKNYVITDIDQNGSISNTERQTFIPAYNLGVIEEAYRAYLDEIKSSTASGVYKRHKYGKTGVSDFNLGTGNGANAIVPAMIVNADDNGVVEIKSLPVGSYLILQVDAGEGYYIDENFKTIVDMCYASGSSSQPQYNQYPSIYVSDGDGHSVITNANAKAPSKPEWSKYNVAHCVLTSTKSGSSHPAKFDLSSVSDYKFTVDDENGTSYHYILSDGEHVGNKSRLNPKADTNKFNAHDTIIRGAETLYLADNDDFNHLSSYTAFVLDEAGNYKQIAQGDGKLDVNGNNKAHFVIRNASNSPVVVDGARVEGNNIVAEYDIELDAKGNPILVMGVDKLPYGSYTMEQTAFGEGYKAGDTSSTLSSFKIRIEDRLGNGNGDALSSSANAKDDDKAVNLKSYNGRRYITNQIVNGGELYTVTTNEGSSDAKVDLAVYNISDHYVYVESTGLTSRQTAANVLHAAGGALTVDNADYGLWLTNLNAFRMAYVPSNTTMASHIAAANDAKTGDGTANASFTANKATLLNDLSAYTATASSDAKRFETIKDLYDAQIAGQTLTMEQVNVLLEGQVPCVTYKDVTPAQAVEKTQSLHYGTYLIVVTKIPTGYKLVSDPFTEDAIDEMPDPSTPEDKVRFEVHIEPADAVPDIDTELLEASNLIDSVKVDKQVALVDHVNLSNLLTARDYRVYGVIVDKATGKLVPGQIATAVINGDKKVPVEATPEKSTAKVDMYFPSQNTWECEGHTFVAYEYVTPYTTTPAAGYNTVTSVEALETLLGSTIIGQHTAIDDEDQTAYTPSMTITAEASITHGKTIDPTETVVGTTTVGNLEPGNTYKLVSYLYDQAGDKVTKDGTAETEPLVVEEQFVATDVTKTCTEKFDGLDATKYNNQRLTVYSTLYRVVDANEYELVTKGDADSIGYDPSDEEPGPNQVDVTAPTVKTTLTGKNNAKRVDFSDPDTTVTLTDSITYTNLIVGGKYRSVLTLVDKTGQPLLDDNGKALTATYEFNATADTHTIKISIDFIATEIAGQDVVAFNDLYRVNSSVIKKVAEEHDLTVAAQTVTATVTTHEPTLVTVAKDSNTKTHTLSLDSSIIDTVNGLYLEPNTKYVLVTELAVNGSVFERLDPIKTSVITDDNGKFVAKVTVGGYNASALKGKKLTIFETLYNEAETKVICEHKDAEDENQTVTFGSLTTVAMSESGKKKIAKDEKAVIIDNLHYEGLTPGYTYTITSQPMLSSGGNGTPVGSPVKTTFTPDTAKGDVSVKVILDTTQYGGMDIVMYETITEDYSDSIVIEHKDISDASQTVTVAGKPGDPDDPDDPDDPNDPDGPGDSDDPKPQTGVDQTFPIYFMLAGITALIGAFGCAGYFFVKRKKSKVSDK